MSGVGYEFRCGIPDVLVVQPNGSQVQLRFDGRGRGAAGRGSVSLGPIKIPYLTVTRYK